MEPAERGGANGLARWSGSQYLALLKGQTHPGPGALGSSRSVPEVLFLAHFSSGNLCCPWTCKRDSYPSLPRLVGGDAVRLKLGFHTTVGSI